MKVQRESAIAALAAAAGAPPEYLPAPAASEYLRARYGIVRKVSTLGKLRVVGGGPAFCKARRQVIYPRCELDAWAESLLSGLLHSTGEFGEAA